MGAYDAFLERKRIAQLNAARTSELFVGAA